MARSRINRKHAENAGLVGWWRSVPGLVGGLKLWDLAGQYHGTLAGRGFSAPSSPCEPVAYPGGVGALLFDGSTTQVNLPSAAYMGSSPYVLACWANPTVTTDVRELIGFGVPLAYSIQLRSNGSNWEFYQRTTTDVGAIAGGVVADAWTRVAALWDGSAIHLGIDGRIVASTACAAIHPPSIGSIGYDAADTGANFDGYIADASLHVLNPIALANPGGYVALDYYRSLRGHPGALTQS